MMVSMAGMENTSASKPHISSFSSGRRSIIRKVAGSRVMSMAVTKAGNMKSTRSWMTARMRVDGSVIPKILMTKPMSNEVMTKHRNATRTNRPRRLGRLMVNRIYLYY